MTINVCFPQNSAGTCIPINMFSVFLGSSLSRCHQLYHKYFTFSIIRGNMMLSIFIYVIAWNEIVATWNKGTVNAPQLLRFTLLEGNNSAFCAFIAQLLSHSPFPSSKKSVMVAEVQRLQGLEASMEVRMEDISRLSLFTPKRSSQNFESSCDKPSRWPVA